MFDRNLQEYSTPLLLYLAKYLVKARISADFISGAGFAFGVIAALLAANSYFLCALIFFLVNRLLDGLDGVVARINGPTHRGAFLDIVFDFIIYSSLPFAFAIFDRNNSFASCFVIFSFIGTGTTFLAYAIMQAKIPEKFQKKIGQKSFYYLGGIAEGAETILFISFILLFPTLFSPAAFLFGTLCWVSSFFRLYAGWQDFSLK